MMSIDEDLPQVMQNIAAEITGDDSDALSAEVSRAAGPTGQPTKPHISGAKPFLAGLAAAAITTFALIASGTLDFRSSDETLVAQHQSTDRLPSDDSIPLDIAPGTPCVGATKVQLAQALAAAKTPIWLPDGRQQLSAAWICGGQTPAFTYGTTTIFFEPGWGDVDIAAKWADLADDYGGRIEQINGQLALIQPATSPGTKSQVMIVHGDTLIRLLGEEGTRVDEAVALANSMKLN